MILMNAGRMDGHTHLGLDGIGPVSNFCGIRGTPTNNSLDGYRFLCCQFDPIFGAITILHALSKQDPVGSDWYFALVKKIIMGLDCTIP